jgi:hypothetical protein
MNETDGDGMCCREITVATRRMRAENGYKDPASWEFVLHVERVDGRIFDVPIASVERVVEFVRTLNPALVHVAALDEHEHATLLAELRAHTAAALAAEIANRAQATPDATLH